ncbi:MAG: aldehyde ferredoxin oxidoreductase [Candidatus Abyssobacteria bacterium SURF_17]|uniref:Aldehyde ferredoxin oxidoreductase n=1 Tax=Candidatus Abyssobacteria bacterium SURF_17 TaxID=2093361 RepID=A0A419EUA5_9BACT|nr:MAG: aldehyde ferredoxin oxidoreductase [Candidatus Abyssubacteria bacterium SURF_17]
MNKILRVDMTAQTVTEEAVGGQYAGLGGRGLTSKIVNAEVPPLCHPLGRENKLVMAPGLLSGTAAPCSGRLSVGGKSPLTGGIKEANAGGTAAQRLGRLGIAAIVVEGEPPKGTLWKLVVTKSGAELLPASEVKGANNYKLVEKLTKTYGDKVSYISIGSAGERLMSAASVAVTDLENRPTRHAGRGGLGAVMGSKGLKAIVLDDKGAAAVPVSDQEAFKQAVKKFSMALKEHAVTGKGLPTYGTNILTNIINEAGGFPTRNFSEGKFEDAAKVSGEMQREIILKRGGVATHPCSRGCVIQCSRIYMDKNKKYLTKGPEYETVWANGPNCGINDLDVIARLDRLYDDIGLDTIEMGATLAVLMESGYIAFGDGAGAIKIIREEVGKATPLGRVLGNGCAVTGQVFGVKRVPVVKRQALPAYDPRAIKGIGVTFATSPMGADHTAGYSITANILNVGGTVSPLKTEGQMELSRNLQIATAAIDSTGLCLFVAFAVLDIPEAFEAIYEMINAQYGLNLGPNDVTALGKTVLKAELEFNAQAGFTAKEDRLPMFFETEKLPPHNTVFDVSHEELDATLRF